ncbi:hypothetical protein ACFCWG_30385, partial [Streptomyces sp. NPDC056390]
MVAPAPVPTPGKTAGTYDDPERLDQQQQRRNLGSRGGRPTGFDGERYKKRNTVERAINRL